MNYRFSKKRHGVTDYVNGILQRDRIMLSRAITLIESSLQSDNEIAEAIIEKILPHTGDSIRVGISGIPGAGKSTFIDAFGTFLTNEMGKRVAVLSIDPSSRITQGSILGDKTRMEDLSNNPNAFIRPSPSGQSAGGIHSRTRESMLLCEAAGFNVIIIETVGVGQNETSVRNFVDFFLLLLVAGAGDELQGIKRGIVEVADAIAINKADGDNIMRAELSRQEYKNALHLLAGRDSGWIPQVITCSARTHTGLPEIWQLICTYEAQMKQSGSFGRQRDQQNLQWMHDEISYQLHSMFYNDPSVQQQLIETKHQVISGELPATRAAKEMLRNLRSSGAPLNSKESDPFQATP